MTCSILEAVGWTPADADQILLVGDTRSVPMLRVILGTLDAKTRGQVFVEVENADEIVALETPKRVTVCWLDRSRSADMVPGQLVKRAADAWLSEMMPFTDAEEHSILAWYATEARSRLLVG
jgi:NADPH-dependent ferric siderophore reductase